MPELPDDDVDSIKNGTYVYWMKQDDDIPRGTLGEVYDVDGEDRKVRFPNWKGTIAARKLNVSDFQKGTLVHRTKDGRTDELGEVKDLDDGQLCIDIDGEKKKEKPKYLIKCDIQIDMFVFWKKSDEDVPNGHVGQVIEVDDGKVRVQFPNGNWRFAVKDLMQANVQPGSYVQWNSSDDDIAEGEIGEVTGKINSEGKIKVRFAKDTWSFSHDSLSVFELQLGAFVKWQREDEDVKKGEVGQVVGIKTSQNRLRVQFPKGRWKFPANELSIFRFQPGNLVTWNKCDEDIPHGDIGEVVRLDDDRLSIQWPKGHWSIKMKEIKKLRFQKGDRVQWTKSDDDIPEGDIGIVMGVRYSEDSGKKLYVTWPNGRWSMKPHTLQALNFGTEGANQLKRAFKRFDLNGDGKLSAEELVGVLSNLGGQGKGLAPEECQQLFDALDKDGNGKLTVSEFIDYVFSGASSASRVVLADGFGLDDFFGFEEDEKYEDEDFEDDDFEDKGQAFEKPFPMKNAFEKASENIDADTEISRAEWVTAMLTVGVPRAAALESFDAVVKELGGDTEVKLQDLAGEINGMGRAAGVQELRDPIGKVKSGQVDLVDLNTPSEEVDFERDLALKTGIDAMIFGLNRNNLSLKEAAEFLPKAHLSNLERKILGEMSPEDLEKALEKGKAMPPTLSAVASWQSCRESCQREVQEIIDRCKSQGERFTDESWNPLENQAYVYYVDKEKPGYRSKLKDHRIPKDWIRVEEWNPEARLVDGGAEFTDLHQGSIGDCFLIAALAAIAANRKSFVRRAVVAYDQEVGVYGMMFCEEMHFVYVIIDDHLAVDSSKRLLYGKNDRKTNEFWVPIIEKAYFKYLGCLEMCWGGWPEEAVYAMLGGLSGQYRITEKEFSDPHRLWKIINGGLENGEILTTQFEKPSKGKYSTAEGGEEGDNGEEGLGMGLHEGHAYSAIRAGEVDGHELVCIRNPWGHGEWTGPWSDKSEEWTDERREKLKVTVAADYGEDLTRVKNDGAFWMAAEDYTQLAHNVKFNRPFGPTWQCCAQYGKFGKDPPFKAYSRIKYRACAENEISFDRGQTFDITKDCGSWLFGVHTKSGKAGYIPKKCVRVSCQDNLKFDLKLTNVSPDARIIIGLFRQNQRMEREYRERKQDGINEQVKDYAHVSLYVHDANGMRIADQFIPHYYQNGFLYLPAKGPFKVYLSCRAATWKRFALYAFAPHGAVHLEPEDCDRKKFVAEVGKRNTAVAVREKIYTDTHETVDEYIHVGNSLFKDYPDIGGRIREVASNISDMLDTDGVRHLTEDAADRVRDFVNSDQVQDVTNKVKDLVGDEAQEMMDQVGSFMNKAKSWWG